MSDFAQSPKGRDWWAVYWKSDKARQRGAEYRKRTADIRRDYERTRNATPKRRTAAKAGLILRKYRLTLDELNQMRIAQDDRCGICSIKFAEQPYQRSSMHIDHCHSMNIVRGLLCNQCNHGLGKFSDNPEVLRRAATYLEEFYEAHAV